MDAYVLVAYNGPNFSIQVILKHYYIIQKYLKVYYYMSNTNEEN